MYIKKNQILTGTSPKYLYAIAWACVGGFLQCLWGFGHAPGIAVFISVQRSEPSCHKSDIPPESVLDWDDHVKGKRLLAHFNNLSLLLNEGQNTGKKKYEV